jgi:hypothetical protein
MRVVMTISRLLAQMTVSDLDRAVSWYARFFGREPDARPMDGLVELDAEGLPYEGPQAVTASRIVQLEDSDGNRIVITGD